MVDFYGRPMPKSVSGNVRLRIATNSTAEIIGSLKKVFDRLIDPTLYIKAHKHSRQRYQGSR